MRPAILIAFVCGSAAPAAAQEIERAAQKWRASCAQPDETGACVAVVALPPAGPRTRCGPPSATGVVVARRSASAERARERLRPLVSSQDAEVAARARFLLAEINFESVLALRFPSGLDFSGPQSDRSKQRFDSWRAALQQRVELAEGAYGGVARGPTSFAPAARVRLAEISAHVAALFEHAPIPPLPKEFPRLAADADLTLDELAREFTKAYCDAVQSPAIPLRDKAAALLEPCPALAPWAARCQAVKARVTRRRRVRRRARGS